MNVLPDVLVIYIIYVKISIAIHLVDLVNYVKRNALIINQTHAIYY